MKNKRIKILVWGTISFLLVAAVFFAMKSSAQGVKLITLETKATTLESENQEIQSEIISDTSLSLIGKEAKTLGLDVPQKYVYLNRDGVALRGADQVATLP